MISFSTATVKEIKRSRRNYVEAIVDLAGNRQKAICYDTLTGPIELGDEVVVNTTAVDLGLGTGGFHFVVWNLNKLGMSPKEHGGMSDGHIMKLRYTPLQLKCLAVEEEDSPFHSILKHVTSIDNMPVIIGTLHSQLPATAVVLKQLRPDVRIAYIMTDGAALPLAFSNLVAELVEKKFIDDTITVGHAFGGSIEAINIYSGLAAAKYVAKADVAIVCMGPGIVGTNTTLGFTGIEQGQIINAVNSLAGDPIAIPRIGFADERERHYGISHHTITALKVAALSTATVVFPTMDIDRAETINKQIEEEGINKLHTIAKVDAEATLGTLKENGFKVTTMGRTIDQEPEFFMAAGAAGIYVAKVLLGG